MLCYAMTCGAPRGEAEVAERARPPCEQRAGGERSAAAATAAGEGGVCVVGVGGGVWGCVGWVERVWGGGERGRGWAGRGAHRLSCQGLWRGGGGVEGGCEGGGAGVCEGVDG